MDYREAEQEGEGIMMREEETFRLHQLNPEVAHLLKMRRNGAKRSYADVGRDV